MLLESFQEKEAAWAEADHAKADAAEIHLRAGGCGAGDFWKAQERNPCGCAFEKLPTLQDEAVRWLHTRCVNVPDTPQNLTRRSASHAMSGLLTSASCE